MAALPGKAGVGPAAKEALSAAGDMSCHGEQLPLEAERFMGDVRAVQAMPPKQRAWCQLPARQGKLA